MIPGQHDDIDGRESGAGNVHETMASLAAAIEAAVLVQDTPQAGSAGPDPKEVARHAARAQATAPVSADDGSHPEVAAGAGAAAAGALALPSIVGTLPDLVHRAERNHERFTLVLARPGGSAVNGEPVPTPEPGSVAELAAAVSASLWSGQELYSYGSTHLAVVIDGKSRRHTSALMQRAAVGGAPTFTWVACHYRDDARNAASLLDLAMHHLDGTALAEGEEIGGAAVWWRTRGFLSAALGSAAALVLGLLFMTGGSPATTPVRSNQGGSISVDTSGQSSTGSGATTGTGAPGRVPAAVPGTPTGGGHPVSGPGTHLPTTGGPPPANPPKGTTSTGGTSSTTSTGGSGGSGGGGAGTTTTTTAHPGTTTTTTCPPNGIPILGQLLPPNCH
jgi:hypothetical protein